MYVGLVDADLLDNGTRFPNLALMKLSSYFNRSGRAELVLDWGKDKIWGLYPQIYISKVFTKTKIPEAVILQVKNPPQIKIGGTGFYFDKAEPLPDEIEHAFPDYHLYDNYISKKLSEGSRKTLFKDYLDSSIGFTTRGCFRHCQFCVNRNCDEVKLHSPISEFLDKSRKNIILLDDNIFGYSKWHKIFDDLDATGKPFRFEQGLDIRLLTREKIKKMLSSKYWGSVIFAFDSLKDKEIIEEKLKLWRGYTDKKTKFFVLSAFESTDEDDIISVFERIKILFKYDSIPYLCRFENWKDSNMRGMYINLSRWANQPHVVKSMSFLEFCLSHNKESSTYKYLKEFMIEYPDIANSYFNIKWGEIK
jgi:hypothetical protein